MSNKHLLQQMETVSYECTTALTPFYIDILYMYKILKEIIEC